MIRPSFPTKMNNFKEIKNGMHRQVKSVPFKYISNIKFYIKGATFCNNIRFNKNT